MVKKRTVIISIGLLLLFILTIFANNTFSIVNDGDWSLAKCQQEREDYMSINRDINNYVSKCFLLTREFQSCYGISRSNLAYTYFRSNKSPPYERGRALYGQYDCLQRTAPNALPLTSTRGSIDTTGIRVRQVGQSCFSSSNCISDRCVNNICIAPRPSACGTYPCLSVGDGGSCDRQSQCESGLTCFEQKCVQDSSTIGKPCTGSPLQSSSCGKNQICSIRNVCELLSGGSCTGYDKGCYAGEICGSNGICREPLPTECSSTYPCGVGSSCASLFQCEGVLGCYNGKCSFSSQREGCTSDNECLSGQTCQLNRCVSPSKGNCLESIDCPAAEICKNNICTEGNKITSTSFTDSFFSGLENIGGFLLDLLGYAAGVVAAIVAGILAIILLIAFILYLFRKALRAGK